MVLSQPGRLPNRSLKTVSATARWFVVIDLLGGAHDQHPQAFRYR